MATITVEQALQMAHGFRQGGNRAAAEGLYRQVLASDPQYAEAWFGLGAVAVLEERFDEAVAHLRHAAESDPGNPNYPFELGNLLRRLDRNEEAVACFRRTMELAPDATGPRQNLGGAFIAMGLFEEAARCYAEVIALAPDLPEAHSNLASAFMQLARFDEAIAACRRAIELRPDFPEAWLNLGGSFLRNVMFEPAIHALRQAIAYRPDFSDAHQTLGFVLLLLERFAEGWREHEWRWQCPRWSPRWRPFSTPRWDGSPAPGRTIWLIAEQGYGDSLQFLRYIPLVRERSGTAVGFYCTPKLERLLAFNGNCDARIIARDSVDGSMLPATDRALPLLSLPPVLKIYEPLPMAGPYLRADPALRDLWRERLRPARGLRVGLAWFGNPGHTENHWRSLHASQLAPLLEVPHVTFVSLQIDRRGGVPGPCAKGSHWLDLTDQITDFADTAAIMAELDLIITTDTAPAHLAGALGRPVWTLIHWLADWRWGRDRDDSPWYPTMRVFRQKAPGEWEEVLRRVARELRSLGSHSPAGS